VNVIITSNVKTAAPTLQAPVQPQAPTQNVPPASMQGGESTQKVNKSNDADLKVLSILDVLLEGLEQAPPQDASQIIERITRARQEVNQAANTGVLTNVIYHLGNDIGLRSPVVQNLIKVFPSAGGLIRRSLSALNVLLSALTQSGDLEIQRHGRKKTAETIPDSARPQTRSPEGAGANIQGGGVMMDSPEGAAGLNAQEVGTNFPVVPQDGAQDKNIKYVDRAVEKLQDSISYLVRTTTNSSALAVQIKNMTGLLQRLENLQKRLKKGH
jgi:hypothetical protein